MQEIHGDSLPELLARLKQIPLDWKGRDPAKNIVRRALRAGAEIIRDAASGAVTRRTGRLAKAIQIVAHVPAAAWVTGLIQTFVAVKSRVAHLIELGVKPHRIEPRSDLRRLARAVKVARATGSAREAAALLIGGHFIAGGVNHPGARPRPFLGPAVQSNVQRIMQTVADTLRAGLHRYDVRRRA